MIKPAIEVRHPVSQLRNSTFGCHAQVHKFDFASASEHTSLTFAKATKNPLIGGFIASLFFDAPSLDNAQGSCDSQNSLVELESDRSSEFMLPPNSLLGPLGDRRARACCSNCAPSDAGTTQSAYAFHRQKLPHVD